jgi:hypothetical protein
MGNHQLQDRVAVDDLDSPEIHGVSLLDIVPDTLQVGYDYLLGLHRLWQLWQCAHL